MVLNDITSNVPSMGLNPYSYEIIILNIYENMPMFFSMHN